jgi:hypothetical protein
MCTALKFSPATHLSAIAHLPLHGMQDSYAAQPQKHLQHPQQDTHYSERLYSSSSSSSGGRQRAVNQPTDCPGTKDAPLMGVCCMQKKAGCMQLSLPDPPAGWTLLSLDLKVKSLKPQRGLGLV